MVQRISRRIGPDDNNDLLEVSKSEASNGLGRKAGVVGEQHHLVAEEGSDGAAFFPTPGRSDGGLLGGAHRSEAFEGAHHMEVLHHRPVWKASHLPEYPTANEETLISIGSPLKTATEMNERLDERGA